MILWLTCVLLKAVPPLQCWPLLRWNLCWMRGERTAPKCMILLFSLLSPEKKISDPNTPGFMGTRPITSAGYAPNLPGMCRSHWSHGESLRLPQQTWHQSLRGAKAATKLSQKAIKAIATVSAMRVNYLGLRACWRRQSVQPHLPGGSFPGTSVHTGCHLISQNNFTLPLCFPSSAYAEHGQLLETVSGGDMSNEQAISDHRNWEWSPPQGSSPTGTSISHVWQISWSSF